MRWIDIKAAAPKKVFNEGKIMKSLLITNINTIWTTEYISNILEKAEVEVYIVGFEPVEDEYKEYYKQHNVHVIDLYEKNTKGNKIVKMLQLYSQIKKSIGKEKFDFIDIQGVPNSIQAYLLIYIIRKFAKNCICTFLGSDLFRVNANKRVDKLMSVATFIVLATKDMQENFKSKYGSVYDKKIVDCKFGTPSYADIGELKVSSSKKECKMFFRFPDDKIMIAIGYNGNYEQQHIKALEQINTMDEALKKKIHVVIHFGYGNDNQSYKESVLEMLNDKGYTYSFIDRAMGKKEIAHLRMATDIFIHAQTSDALSGSIREMIYAESILINPSWIEYSDFQKAGISYLQYDFFSEIPNLIINIINKKTVIDLKKNAELAYDRYSWESVSSQWMEIYDKR